MSTAIRTFTNRWVALSIDFIAVFTVFFFIKYTFEIAHNWSVFLSLYALFHVIIPAVFFNGVTLGKKIMRLKLLYPEKYNRFNRATAYMLRELIKGALVLGTAGIGLIVSGLIIAETGKPALHEKMTRVLVIMPIKEKDLPVKDAFDGKLKF